ncbi:hypothetical protein SAMN05660330_04320 [Desulforhopalus singaporensis]|uniref:Uncharacterized protein n=1 Tax=Desulforhopalus singaporensis TaxID=91360 RepID=A0A1H0VYM2_9BACT|nr:hypothetical protein SAMN05660330_04320 [Desulforhopalus singaporensis]
MRIDRLKSRGRQLGYVLLSEMVRKSCPLIFMQRGCREAVADKKSLGGGTGYCAGDLHKKGFIKIQTELGKQRLSTQS